MKKQKKNKRSNRLVMWALGLLGFSTSFVLVACYAPAPNNYQDVAEMPDFGISDSTETLSEEAAEILSEEGDSQQTGEQLALDSEQEQQ